MPKLIPGNERMQSISIRVQMSFSADCLFTRLLTTKTILPCVQCSVNISGNMNDLQKTETHIYSLILRMSAAIIVLGQHFEFFISLC